MKKALSLVLILTMCLSFCACGNSNNKTKQKVLSTPETTTKKSIRLTTDNIDDYIAIRGEYKNGKYHRDFLDYYISTADIDFQAYSIASGTFDNVEITVNVDLSEKEGALGNKWHLTNSESRNVEITFKMPANGEYSSTYSIECDRSTAKLSGSSKLEIVEVSGIFIPNN